MPTVSGNTGSVELDTVLVAKVLLWTADYSRADHPQVHSDSAPWPERTMGNFDLTGTVQLEAPDGAIPTAIAAAIAAGTAVVLELIVDKDDASPTIYTGSAKILGASDIGSNINSGEPVNHTYNFGANGAWTIPTA